MQTPQQIATGVVNEFPGNEGNNLIKVAIIAAALQAYGAACASEMRDRAAQESESFAVFATLEELNGLAKLIAACIRALPNSPPPPPAQ